MIDFDKIQKDIEQNKIDTAIEQLDGLIKENPSNDKL